jgi:hypothetical protein
MGSNSLFPFYQNFALDPNNYETFYLPTTASIWRKENLKAASYDTNLRNAGWSHLSNVDVGAASEISFIAVSKNPANRVYYGTSLGKVYRIDDANTGNPFPEDISGDNFPFNAFVACIDLDETNADNIVVVFSNYEVPSIFSSSDGGVSWTAQGGNLEEFPNGLGSGPSVRFVKSLTYGGHNVWFAGTSAGLYSATDLNGDLTEWKREGAESIGSVIIDMIDARQSDGFVAIGTHGNGVYSTWYDPSLGLADNINNSGLTEVNLFPNPARDRVFISGLTGSAGTIEVLMYSMNGEQVLHEYLTGQERLTLELKGITAGTYLLKISSKSSVETKRLVLW